MADDIRCTDCKRMLAKVAGPTLTIVCPRCGKLHTVPIIELVASLTAYLDAVEARAGEAGGKGFML